jgi:TonB-dependent receptor
LRGGVNYKKYSFESTELRRWNGVSTANQESVIPAALAAIPRSSYATMVDFPGKGLDLPAGSVTGWVVPDLEAARDILQFFNPGVFGGAFRLGKDPALGNNFTVDEDDLGGWAQGDFDFDVFGVPVRGNVGVRYVRTKQATTGFSFVGGSAKLITVERQYHDTLPAGNIVIEPFENLLVRFAGAKVMSRPDLGNLNPGSTVNVAGANRTVASGNPNLEPFRAKTYDVAVEWYFMPESLISLALFKKNISTFIQTVTFQSTFSGNSFGLPDSLVIDACSGLPPATCNPTTTIWTFTVPDNTPGGPLKGLEVGYQQPFTFLPGFFSHFGVQGNYTYLTSKIQYKLTNAPDSPTVIDELVNVSRHAYNATVYWENDVFSARVAMAFRDKYLTRVPAREGTDVEGTNSTFNLDFAAQYEIIEGLKVTVDGLNLTDEFDDQFVGSANRLSFYHHQGREVLFGFRYTH